MPQLTSKELSGLEDILTCEDIIIKKYKGYATLCENKDIKDRFLALADEHSRFYNTLLGQLQ